MMRCACGHQILHAGQDNATLKARTRMTLIRDGAVFVVCPECHSDVRLATVERESAGVLARALETLLAGRARLAPAR